MLQTNQEYNTNPNNKMVLGNNIVRVSMKNQKDKEKKLPSKDIKVIYDVPETSDNEEDVEKEIKALLTCLLKSQVKMV